MLVVAYFLFCMLFLGLRYVVLPNIDNYKADIEKIATRAIGNKVSIDTLDASWKGLNPQLVLNNIAIYDKAGKEALHLPEVFATVSWWSVVAAEVRLNILEISDPQMDIVRDAQGNFYVAGIFIDRSKNKGNSNAADWILSQHKIVIRDGTLRWKDEQRGAPELLLKDVNVILRNQWRDHHFALKATPPAEFASPIDIRAAFSHPRFTRHISQVVDWKGEIYADISNTDLTVWKRYVDYPVDLGQGKGSIRAWVDFDHASVRNVTADLSLKNVSTRLHKDMQPLELLQVDGRVAVHDEYDPTAKAEKGIFGKSGHSFALTDFSLQTTDGLILAKTSFKESFFPAKNGRPSKTEIATDRLDLKTLTTFAERLPLTDAQRQILADFAPVGVLKGFSAQWQGSYPDIAGYRVKGQFEDLSVKAQAARLAQANQEDATSQPDQAKEEKVPAQKARPAIPGFENLTGWIDANDKGGAFGLSSKQVKFEFPGYFLDPVMPFDRLDIQASWSLPGKEQLILTVSKADFWQGKLSGSLSGKHQMSLKREQGQSPGIIDLTGRVNGLELDKVRHYLPINTPAALSDWLTGALAGGTAEDVKVRIKGDLARFPFAAQNPAERRKGEFSVLGRIKDGKLNYTPGKFSANGKLPFWPLLEKIDGTIAFDRSRMEINAESAATHGVTLSNVRAVIPDLITHERMLDINGNAAGALQDFVDFTNDSPVAEWIGHFTEETKATGNAGLALKLCLPLSQLAAAKVLGTLQFTNNNVILQNILPAISGANGKLEFHEKGFSLPGGIKGAFLGGPVVISGGMQRDGNILVKADGALTADGLRKTYPALATRQLAPKITGATRYSTQVRVKNHHPEIIVESNLFGLGLNFPIPLRKATAENLPLRFELTGFASNEASLMRDEIKLSLGSSVAARYERQRSSEKGAPWQVVRGGIGVNVPAPQPDSGVVANVSLKTLNIDEWTDSVASAIPSDKSAANEKPASGNGLSIAQYIEPEVLAARTNELIVMGKKLNNVVVGASHQKQVWQANIDSEQASGYVTWNQSLSGRGLGKVTARLASLQIPKTATSDVTDLLEGKNEATQMPAVDLVVENFELFGKKFGHVELAANNARGPTGREWQIHKLSIVNPDGQLKATGKWAISDGSNMSSLAYTLNIVDSGKLLDRLGFGNVVHGGKGRMEGEVSWKGPPFSLDIPSLSGNLQLQIASGQFLKVDPSAAKLLGVLNLQSLPRRLVLDFRDVFSEGFAFDSVTAGATITQGLVTTDNFKMRGVAATVLIDGTADIAKESQNLHVVVIPEINVGAASVVYGLAVNPVIGVGTFLAQLFLRDPLMKAFTFEYQISGPWKEPVVNKLQRKSGPVKSNEATRVDEKAS